MIDATASESLMKMTPEEAYELLEDIAFNAFNQQSQRPTRKPAVIHSIDTLSSLSTQMELLSKKMDNLNSFSNYPKDASCDLSARD